MDYQANYKAHFHNYFRLVGVVVSGPRRVIPDDDKKPIRTEFIVAVKRADTSMTYVPVMCLGKQAERATIIATKMSKVAVEGMIATRIQKRKGYKAAGFIMYLIASDIVLLERIRTINVTNEIDYFKKAYEATSLNAFSLDPPFKIPPANKIKKPKYTSKKGTSQNEKRN